MNRGVVMLESGVFQRHVAGILNPPRSVIFQMWNRHLTHRNMAEDETGLQLYVRAVFLLIQSLRQRFHNASSLNNEFRNGTGVRISTQTVRKTSMCSDPKPGDWLYAFH